MSPTTRLERPANRGSRVSSTSRVVEELADACELDVKVLQFGRQICLGLFEELAQLVIGHRRSPRARQRTRIGTLARRPVRVGHCAVGAIALKTWRSWCSASRSRCCAARCGCPRHTDRDGVVLAALSPTLDRRRWRRHRTSMRSQHPTTVALRHRHGPMQQSLRVTRRAGCARSWRRRGGGASTSLWLRSDGCVRERGGDVHRSLGVCGARDGRGRNARR